MKYLAPEEVRKFLEAVKYSVHSTLFQVVLETGMRPEEYLALKWKDIDFERRQLIVRRAIIWNRKGGGYYFSEPKTKTSRRSIPLSSSSIISLKSHRRLQLETKMRCGGDFNKEDIVFVSTTGTPLMPKNLTQRHFRPILKEAGVRQIRLYDLRHTTATMLLISRENPKVVQERLGHASVALTLDTYSHVLPNMQEEATAKLEEMMYGA